MTIRPPRASLRTYLLMLMAGAVVPVLCFAGYLALALGRIQQEAVERGLIETAAALATSVDRQLMSTITTLEALAASEQLDGGDHHAFVREAQRVLASQSQHGWLTVHLASADGVALVNALTPIGTPAPLADTATVKQVAATAKPVISDLLPEPVRGQAAFAVRVPVVREGTVKYVLSAILVASSMAKALSSQEDLPDRIAVLYDRESSIVFRTVNADRLIGTRVTPRLAQGSLEQEFGAIDDVDREGTAVRTVFRRSRLSGWSVAVGVPHHALYAAQRRSLANVGAVGAILLGVSLLATLLVARRIRRSVGDLVVTADTIAIPHGTPTIANSPISELNRLGHALAAAGRLIRERGDSVERQLDEFRAAREVAEEGNRAKDEFLSLLSHELRTPLNAIYGWARMLRAGQVSPEALPRALDAMVRNADAQLRLIDDLLDVSRITSGKMRLDVQAVDPNAVVENALESVRPLAEAKGIRLDSALDPRAGSLMGDPARLQQVIWNLLMNAVKFTESGGRVHVDVQRLNAHIAIVVSDTGQGIGPDLLPLIFERFRQGDSSSTRAHGGLGLGLTLVKHLVDLHGGTVVAHSSGAGKGATFVVTLPLSTGDVGADPAPSAPAAPPIPAADPRGVRLDGLRVLVVDDDRDAVELVSAILTRAGAVVRACGSAREALAILQQRRPDILLSDIEMPGEDGYSLIRSVRALLPEHGGNTPAVALTAYGRMQDRTLALSAGYNVHVQKPVDPAELTAAVASVGALTGSVS